MLAAGLGDERRKRCDEFMHIIRDRGIFFALPLLFHLVFSSCGDYSTNGQFA
jgi:hypothetical protein